MKVMNFLFSKLKFLFATSDKIKNVNLPEGVKGSHSNFYSNGYDSAKQLLFLLQKKGRLIDFLNEDLTMYTDTEIGATVRVVHEGCKAVINEYIKLTPVCNVPESESITLPSDFDKRAIQLFGNIKTNGPYEGRLSHKGWKIIEMHLPKVNQNTNLDIIAAAQVELCPQQTPEQIQEKAIELFVQSR